MVNRDPRYLLIPTMYQRGRVKSFNDIFEYIPKTVVAGDLGIKVTRFNNLMSRVENFVIRDVMLIGSFCELNLDVVLELWKNEYLNQKRTVPGMEDGDKFK
jgi:hypothetical protein